MSSTSTSASEPTIGRLGRFELKEVVAEGAFGRVYRAYDPQLERAVALKVPKFSSRDTKRVKRFLAEAKSAARLRHPNIVPTFERGRISGRYYIATDFVKGESLAARLARERIPTRVSVKWIRDLAGALSYAHGEGIVHRDIKPQNVMIDEVDRPQLMDFGLAKRLDADAEMTVDGSVLGTPAYMAPEQARGDVQHVGPTADQYALGVVLFELLTGEKPFEGSSHEVIRKVLTEEPPRLRGKNTRISRDLEAICLKALSKNTSDRYVSCRQMAAECSAYLDGDPLLARPVRPWERAVKWARRSPAVASLSFALLLCLIMSVVIITDQYGKTRAALIDSEQKNDALEEEKAKLEKARNSAERYARDAQVNLSDLNAKWGIVTDPLDDAQQSLLWFANAARLSSADRLRRQENRVRFRAFASETLFPIRAASLDVQTVDRLVLDPAGKWLAISARREGNIPQWSKFMLDAGDAIRWTDGAADFSQSGDRSVTARELAGAWTIEVFDPRQESLSLWTVPYDVRALRLSPDASAVAVSGHDESGDVVEVFDVDTETRLLRTEGPIRELQFSPSNKLLAIASPSGDGRGIVQVYDLRSGKKSALQSIEHGIPTYGPCGMVAWLDGDQLVVAGGAKAVIFDVRESKRTEVKPPSGLKHLFGIVGTPTDKSAFVLGDPFGVVLTLRRDGEPELKTRVEHGAYTTCGAYSPDGKTVVSGNWNLSIKVTDVGRTDPQLKRYFQTETPDRLCVSDGGRVLASVTNQERLIVYLADFNAHYRPLQPTGVLRVAGRSGEFAFIQGERGEIASGELLGSAHAIVDRGDIRDVAVDSATGLVVSVGKSSQDKKGFVLVRSLGDEEPEELDIEIGSEPRDVEISPHAKFAAVADAGGEVTLMDLQQRRKKWQGRNPRDDTPSRYSWGIELDIRLQRLRFLNRGKMLVTCGLGNRVTFWDTGTGEILSDLQIENDLTMTLAINRSGNKLAVGTRHGKAVIIDLESRQRLAMLQHPDTFVPSLAFSPDGRMLVTACLDGQVRLWRLGTPTPVRAMEHDDEVFDVAFSASGRWIASSGQDGVVQVWSAHTGLPVIPKFMFKEYIRDAVYQVKAISNRDAFVAANERQTICIDLSRLDDAGNIDDGQLLTMGSLIANGRIVDDRAVTRLTADEWFSKWNLLRASGFRPLDFVRSGDEQ